MSRNCPNKSGEVLTSNDATTIEPGAQFVKKTLSDIKDFYNKQYNSNLASIVVVGDITQEELLPKLNFLNKWEGSDVYINKNLPFEETDGKKFAISHEFRC